MRELVAICFRTGNHFQAYKSPAKWSSSVIKVSGHTSSEGYNGRLHNKDIA